MRKIKDFIKYAMECYMAIYARYLKSRIFLRDPYA